VTPKDRFAELEKKVHQVADRLKTAHQKQVEQADELQQLRKVLQRQGAEPKELEQEIRSLKKEREVIKNKVEHLIDAIDRASGE
jgi:chromosome segregation ATPase